MRANRIIFMMLLCGLATGCSISLGQTGPSDSCKAGVKVDAAGVVRHTGELTRKGSDTDSWWALRIDSGTVYRLELADKALEKSFFDWQYRRVTVTGILSGKVLSIDVICVHEARLD